MASRNFFFPLWQGASHRNTLFEGATKLRDTLEEIVFTSVPVTEEEELSLENDILGYESILKHQKEMRRSLEDLAGEKILTLGGGCDADMLAITERNFRHKGDMALLWIDAHGDLNTPETSPSKLFHGMPLRTALGEGNAALLWLCFSRLRPEQILFAGVRDLDPPEEQFLRDNNIRRLDPESLSRNPESLREALLSMGYGHVYIHLDLDVLEPGHIPGLLTPAPGGISPETLEHLLALSEETLPVTGFALTEYVYQGPRDLELGAKFLRKGYDMLKKGDSRCNL